MTEPTIRTVVLEDVIQSSTGAAASNGADDAPEPLVLSPGLTRSSDVLWPRTVCHDETEARLKMKAGMVEVTAGQEGGRVPLKRGTDAAGAGVLRPARDDQAGLHLQQRGA